MKITKLFVFSGAFDQDRAGDTFCPPHMRIGSSAALRMVSIPPSIKDEDETENAACAARPSCAPNAKPSSAATMTVFVILLMCKVSLFPEAAGAYHSASVWKEALRWPHPYNPC